MRAPIPRTAVVVGLALLASSGCNRLQGVPTGRGWSAYRIGGLTLELPEDWVARGDALRLTARSPDGRAKVEAARLERAFASGAECLSKAEQSLARSAPGLERARHHPTKLGDRDAVTLEADQGGWHGWAWAACDGPQQYRLSFFGASPMDLDAVTAQRGIESSVRFDGKR
jgi:hypothetical protein